MPLPLRFVCAASLGLALLAAAPPPAVAQRGALPAGGPQALIDASARVEPDDPDHAVALLESAVTQAADAGQPALEAEARRRLASAHRRRRDDSKAIPELRRARELLAAAGDRGAELRVEVDLADVCWAVGDTESARAHAQSAANTARAIGDADGFARAAEALVYYLPATIDRAALRREALALTGPDGARIACGVMHNYADDLFNEGRGAEAFDLATQARVCFQRAGRPDREGRVLVSLGRLYRQHGRLDDALAQYRAALALHDRPDSLDDYGAAQATNAIAVTLALMGRFDEARVHYEAALERARRRVPGVVGVLIANLGGFYLDVGQYREALALLDEGLARGAGAPHLPRRLIQRGTALMRLGRTAEAQADFDRAVTLTASLAAEEMSMARQFRAGFHIAQARFAEAADDLRVALDGIEALRAKSVPSDAMRRTFLDQRETVFGTMIELLAAQGKAGEALEIAERARARAFLDLRADRAGDGALARPATVDEARRAAARHGSTIVAYWVGPTSTSIWVVRPDREPALVTVPVLRTRLTALVGATAGIDAGGSVVRGLLMTARAQRAPWRELDALLIAPIRHLLPRQRGSRLTIVPHGPLLPLSFAALSPRGGGVLLEAHDIHYVPAIAMLAAAPAEADSAARRGRGALLVGDPGALRGEPAGDSLPALPWARREVRAIRAALGPDTAELTDADASEGRVRAAIGHRRVVHFATHGVVSNEPARPSYIALQPSPGDDGRLLADEIYDLPLDADLVVLSACRTALGPIAGDGVIGLSRAFLSAGARSVVATQWDVSDRVSYEVMRTFYARRAAGASKSRALRAAQLAALRGLRAGTLRADGVALPEAPRLWAGFVLIGEP